MRLVTFGIESPDADVRATNVEAMATETSFALAFPRDNRETRSLVPSFPPSLAISLRLGGHFNVMNALAAASVGVALGMPADVICTALGSVGGVPGRFEAVSEGQEFAVIVDYAHSPDGLENVLRAARALNPSRVLVVFGCGGDRDRGKRPLMGQLSAELADVAYVTSDNPRSEDPDAIIRDILAGMKDKVGASWVVEPDRRAAIRAALRAARPGDLVLIAGKGHEDYQIFADRTIHFDDREVVREVLKELRTGSEPT